MGRKVSASPCLASKTSSSRMRERLQSFSSRRCLIMIRCLRNQESPYVLLPEALQLLLQSLDVALLGRNCLCEARGVREMTSQARAFSPFLAVPASLVFFRSDRRAPLRQPVHHVQPARDGKPPPPACISSVWGTSNPYEGSAKEPIPTPWIWALCYPADPIILAL